MKSRLDAVCSRSSHMTGFRSRRWLWWIVRRIFRHPQTHVDLADSVRRVSKVDPPRRDTHQRPQGDPAQHLHYFKARLARIAANIRKRPSAHPCSFDAPNTEIPNKSRRPPDAFASTARTTRTIRIHCFVFVIENESILCVEKEGYHELYIGHALQASPRGAPPAPGPLRPCVSSSTSPS